MVAQNKENFVIRGTYYPHIDGLRAFAVLSVLVFHAYPILCSGGFIGVDVFFCISGYLITKGLLVDLENGEYTVGKFYVRRIRRILPAYIAMIVFTIVLCSICYYGESLNLFAKTALSSAFFSTNLFFLNHSDYFSPNSHENPLLNLWSLSVEEQFYIFFPILLAALHRWFRSGVKICIWSLAFLSLVGSSICVFMLHKEALAFYLLPTRAWELLAGCILAMHFRDSFKLWHWNVFALAALLASFFLYSSEMPFPGFTALLPVICAVILLASGNAGLVAPILQNPLTVFIGKISYSLYLFHWPLLVCSHFALDDYLPCSLVSFVALALSFVCSILSWRYIEMPIRKTRWASGRYFSFAALSIFGACLLSVCMYGVCRYERLHKKIIVELYWDGVAPSKEHYSDPMWEMNENRTSNSLTVLGKDETPNYVLWGDSHAMAAAPGWFAFSEETGINGIYINRKHTLLRNSYNEMYANNAVWIEEVLQWLQQHPELKNVILMNRWAVRAQCFCNEDGRKTIYKRRDNVQGTPSEIFELGLTEICEALHQMGKNTIIISSVPEQEKDVPSAAAKFGLFCGEPHFKSISYDKYQIRQKEVKAALNRIEEKGLARIVWVDDVFYPNGTPVSLVRKDNVCLYVDDDHLSPSGAKFLMQYLEKKIVPLLK